MAKLEVTYEFVQNVEIGLKMISQDGWTKQVCPWINTSVEQNTAATSSNLKKLEEFTEDTSTLKIMV